MDLDLDEIIEELDLANGDVIGRDEASIEEPDLNQSVEAKLDWMIVVQFGTDEEYLVPVPEGVDENGDEYAHEYPQPNDCFFKKAFWEQHCKYLIYSIEKGIETGRYHYQAFLQLHKKKSWKQIKEACTYPERMSLKATFSSAERCRQYCSKMDATHCDGPFEFGSFTARGGAHDAISQWIQQQTTTRQDVMRNSKCIPHQQSWLNHWDAYHELVDDSLEEVRDVQRYTWQTQVLQQCNQPYTPRKLFWIWSQEKNTGKTSIAKLLELEGKTVITADPKESDRDIAYCMKTMGKKVDILHFDLPEENEYKNLAGKLEYWSNRGKKIVTKYSSAPLVWTGHLIITTNMNPNMNVVSGVFNRFIVIEANTLY